MKNKRKNLQFVKKVINFAKLFDLTPKEIDIKDKAIECSTKKDYKRKTYLLIDVSVATDNYSQRVS